ncbi:MAG: Ada metal-binding domain-containing protein, partial [Ktedonobacterales bacterium]
MGAVLERKQTGLAIDRERAEDMDARLLEQEDVLWARVIARDRAADGTFVYAVRSTRVY